MLEVVIDTLKDSLKLLPFLFLTFLFLEYIEHKTSSKLKKMIEKSGKLGPIIGSFLGAFPQCGFSVVATNLYATRVITLGTLISIYLSTSDEMLPILISEKVDIKIILMIILIKIIAGIIVGILIDLIIRKKDQEEINHFCHEEHCDCEHSILKSTCKHTFNILFFIMIVTFVLNLGFFYLGEEKLSELFMKNNFFSPFITSLVGLIPNCGASVALTELYLNGAITLGSSLAGLLTGSGVALLVLFKVNKDKLENFKIITLLYSIGVIVGMLVNLLGL